MSGRSRVPGLELGLAVGPVADEDELLACGARGVEPTRRVLAPADARLLRRRLRDRDPVAGVVTARHELVDHAGGGGPRSGHDRGADAVGIDRRAREAGDRELVEVARDRDPRVDGTERVELLAHRRRRRWAGRRSRCAPHRARCRRPRTAVVDAASRCRRCRRAGWSSGPNASTCARNAASSVSCSRVNACAAVPMVGMPQVRPASRFEVASNPAM